MPDAKADDEMLDLALHIIKKKAGRFDPTTFDDRYDAALLKLVKQERQGLWGLFESSLMWGQRG